MRPLRPLASLAALGLLVGAPLYGGGSARAQGAATGTAQAASPVAAPLQALAEGLTKAEKISDYTARAALLGPLIDHAFDMPAVLKASVGLRYAAIPADQKQQLLATFHDFTVARYLSNFGPGSGTALVVHDAAPYAALPGSQLVHTQITSTGESHDVNYIVHQGPLGWQATDALLDGTISQVAVQRSDFTAQLNAGGAPALIAGLKKKIATLSGS